MLLARVGGAPWRFMLSYSRKVGASTGQRFIWGFRVTRGVLNAKGAGTYFLKVVYLSPAILLVN